MIRVLFGLQVGSDPRLDHGTVDYPFAAGLIGRRFLLGAASFDQ